MDQKKAKIKAFISRFFRICDLGEDEDIFALGFVSSMFAVQLVLFVEQEFDITVEHEDLDFENFRTINAIAKLIEQKTRTDGSAEVPLVQGSPQAVRS